MIASPNQFSAASSAIGYLYQIRCALLESLRRLPDGHEFTMSIETLDAVVFDQDGNYLNIAAEPEDLPEEIVEEVRNA